MMAKTGRRTVPQIYIDEKHIGGYDDLSLLDHKGELSTLLLQSDGV
jgi:glutaredoxin 3